MDHRWDFLLDGYRKEVFAIFVGLVLSALIFLPASSLSASAKFPDRLELLRMLREGNFEALDAQISADQKAYEARRVSEKEDLVVFTLDAFRSSDLALEPKFGQWIKRMPRSYAARIARGRYYRHLGWTSRGGAYASETPGERMEKMREYFTKALLDYQESLSLNPKLSVAYAALIELAMAYGDRQAIQDLVNKAKEIDPYSFEVGRSYVFALQPKWGGSLQEMKAFVDRMDQQRAKNPGLAVLRGYVHYTEADILVGSGKRHEAVEFYNKAVQSGEHWWFVYERGNNYYFLNEYDKALADFNTALKLSPQNSRVLAAMGHIHAQQNKLDQALEEYNLALKLNPLAPENLWGRALVLAGYGRVEEALEDIQKAFKFGGDDYTTACAIVDVLAGYLELCESGHPCNQKRQDWAASIIVKTARSFKCPKMFLNWRHVWRALK